MLRLNMFPDLQNAPHLRGLFYVTFLQHILNTSTLTCYIMVEKHRIKHVFKMSKCSEIETCPTCPTCARYMKCPILLNTSTVFGHILVEMLISYGKCTNQTCLENVLS